MNDLHPWSLSTPSEKKSVLILLRRIDRCVVISEKVATADALRNELDNLCGAVLKREIGLERFMVVRMANSANLLVLQVLRFAIDKYQHDEPQWILIGRRLLKDGSTSIFENYFFSFCRENIERRMANGGWAPLVRHQRPAS